MSCFHSKLKLCILIGLSAVPSALWAQDPKDCIPGQTHAHPLSPRREQLQSLADENRREFLSSPEKFTRSKGKIKEGAIYRSDGSVLCILKDDPGAYLYNPNSELDERHKKEAGVTGSTHPSIDLCEAMKASTTKLTIPNGDFLNRLQWSIAEGNCSATISASMKGKSVDTSKAPTPMYFQGYVLNNLRKSSKSEEAMLRTHCNSGPGQDFYSAYFVTGSGHAAPSFQLITTPFSWADAPFDEAFGQDKLEKKIKYCTKDLFASVNPNTQDDPTQGKAFWAHSSKPCSNNALSVKFSYGGKNAWATPMLCCFHNNN